MQLRTDCPVQAVSDYPLTNLRGIYQTEVLKILVWPVHSQELRCIHIATYTTLVLHHSRRKLGCISAAGCVAAEREFQYALYSGWVHDSLGGFCALAL